MASYVKIKSPTGYAYFEETPNGLSANIRPEVYQQLTTGQIQATEQAPTQATPTATRFANPNPTPSTPQPTLPAPQPAPGGDLVSFSSALNQAVNLARQNRNQWAMQFLGDKIPSGALPASSFGDILANVNRASSNFTEPLVKSAEDAFKEVQSKAEKERNSIRDLAITALQNNASQDTVDAILNSKTLDSAISIAGTALNKKSSLDIRTIGGKLVSVDPKTGETKVVFDGGGVDDSGGGTNVGDNEDVDTYAQRLNAGQITPTNIPQKIRGQVLSRAKDFAKTSLKDDVQTAKTSNDYGTREDLIIKLQGAYPEFSKEEISTEVYGGITDQPAEVHASFFNRLFGR